MKYHPHKEKPIVITDDKGIFCVTRESEMVDILVAMNTIVLSLNDEEAYFNSWFDLVGDEADRDDFEDIVKNFPDLAEEIIERFAWVVKHYIK